MTVTVSGTNGISTQGLELIGKTSWETSTSSVSFNISSRYEMYLLTWWVDHSPSWFQSYLRFKTASTTITSGYKTTSEWVGSSATTSAANNGYGGQNAGGIWLTGNGNGFDSHGMALISIPNTGLNYAAVRSNAFMPARDMSDPLSYMEQSSGSTTGSDYGNTITGITFYGSSGFSRRGYVSLQGIKK